jgi:hypothetical protein
VSSIEDEISQAMARHADEAPRVADLLRALEQAPASRRHPAARSPGGWRLPLAAAAAVVAVAAGSAWAGGLTGGGQQAPGRVASLSCPAAYAGPAPWVPGRPHGVSGRSRLVPQRTPASAVVCAYAASGTGRQQAGQALSGRRQLTGGLARLAGELSWQSHPLQTGCALASVAPTSYLIGLTYPGGGRMWVSITDDPSGCTSTSNGEFTAGPGPAREVSKALASGRWPAPLPVTCSTGAGQDIGRLGQGTAMVPPGPASLTICTHRTRTLTSGYQTLVAALNSLPTRLSTASCSPGPGPAGPGYQLLFTYPRGPAVDVDITPRCHPEIDNLSLQSASATTILPIIRHLLNPK